MILQHESTIEEYDKDFLRLTYLDSSIPPVYVAKQPFDRVSPQWITRETVFMKDYSSRKLGFPGQLLVGDGIIHCEQQRLVLPSASLTIEFLLALCDAQKDFPAAADMLAQYRIGAAASPPPLYLQNTLVQLRSFLGTVIQYPSRRDFHATADSDDTYGTKYHPYFSVYRTHADEINRDAIRKFSVLGITGIFLKNSYSFEEVLASSDATKLLQSILCLEDLTKLQVIKEALGASTIIFSISGMGRYPSSLRQSRANSVHDEFLFSPVIGYDTPRDALHIELSVPNQACSISRAVSLSKPALDERKIPFS